MEQLTNREQAMLIGMFLSKYDAFALKEMGFKGFTEAFNVIGFSLGVKPFSIKNYRDEFDAIYPNPRRGWHNRPMRTNCKEIYDKFDFFDFTDIFSLVNSFLHFPTTTSTEEDNYSFARRLATGLAAENFFVSVYQTISGFQGLHLEDRTNDGCGYDFKLHSVERIIGVEVKGLSENHGNILMTEKEYTTASKMKENYYLFIVKNFIKKPEFIIYQNPINQSLNFRVQQRQVLISNWAFSI